MAAISFINQNIHFPAASEFIGKQCQSKYSNRIYNRANMLNVQWHNHSLNLTEPAVDDLTRAKQSATIGHDLSRADWIPALRHFVAAA